MKSNCILALALLLASCASEETWDPLDEYEELDPATILDAPAPSALNVAPENRDAVSRGEYLVELLGCGSCHTDGALIGEPVADRSLAGSRIGNCLHEPAGRAISRCGLPAQYHPGQGNRDRGLERATDCRIDSRRHWPARQPPHPCHAMAGLRQYLER